MLKIEMIFCLKKDVFSLRISRMARVLTLLRFDTTK